MNNQKNQRRPRVVVLASGQGTNLRRLLEKSRDGEPYEIGAVISNNPGSGALQAAEEFNVQRSCLNHREYADRDEYDQALLKLVRSFSPDLIVLAGFMRILSGAFVSPMLGKIINIHPSLLPKYPGLNPHLLALEAGDAEHGATVHFVTEELDAGPRIIQGRVALGRDDNADNLPQRVRDEVEYQILPAAVRWFCEGRLRLDGERAWLDNQPLPDSGYQYLNEASLPSAPT